MTTTPPPLALRTRAGGASPVSVALGILLILLAVFLMIQQTAFRTVEATVTAGLVGLFTHGRVQSAGDVVYFGLGTGNVHGILITTLCSSVILVTPLLALAGILLFLPGFRMLRIASGLLLALAIAVTCNMLRYAGSAFALQTWGTSGFDVVHEYAGSLLVIFGFAGSFILLIRIASRSRRRHRHARHGG